jgi:hypothetical protein
MVMDSSVMDGAGAIRECTAIKICAAFIIPTAMMRIRAEL